MASSHLNTILIIDAYADNKLKENTLKKCIESLKKLEFDLLITTHKQINEEISNMVDYVIFDKDNRFNQINFYLNYYQTSPKFDIEITTTPDMGVKGHEFPIIKSIRNALSFSNGLGYDYFIFTEFDSIFSENDLEKIKNLLANHSDKEFVVLRNEENCYETIFFMGKISFFLDKFNGFFPKTLEEYNENFTYVYPYSLEHFVFKMLADSLDSGFVINYNFSNYFDSYGKNFFRFGSYDIHIIKDQNNRHHVCVQNLNNIACNVELFVDGIRVYDNKISSTLDHAYVLNSDKHEIKCLFKESAVLLKEIDLFFDINNDYSKYGNLLLK